MREFAVIETGGKQYKASVGDRIKVEKIPFKREGDTVIFDRVLLFDNGNKTEVGTPYLIDRRVEAKLEKVSLSRKITVVRYKAKSRYYKRRGHRQPYCVMLIERVF